MAREGDLAVAREAEIVRPLHFVVVDVFWGWSWLAVGWAESGRARANGG